MGKRYDAEMFLEEVADGGTHGCDYLLTTDMDMEPVPGYAFASWEQGYGDVHLVPDLATLRVASWLDRTALVLCDVTDMQTHELVAVAPQRAPPPDRRRDASRLRRPWPPPSSSTTSTSTTYPDAAAATTPASIPPAGTSRTTTSSRAPAPRTSTPRSAGTSSAPACRSRARRGVGPRPARAERALRREPRDGRPPHRLQAVPEGARRAGGLSVTFMAKFAADQAGSSCHIHLSLWRDGSNAFAGDDELDGVACSDSSAGSSAAWSPTCPT